MKKNTLKKIGIGAALVVAPVVVSGQAVEPDTLNSILNSDLYQNDCPRANPKPKIRAWIDARREFSKYDRKMLIVQRRLSEQSEDIDSNNYVIRTNPMPLSLFRKEFIAEFSRYDWKMWRLQHKNLEQSANVDSATYTRADPMPPKFWQRHNDIYLQSKPKTGYHIKK
jgi:hypothetical protein